MDVTLDQTTEISTALRALATQLDDQGVTHTAELITEQADAVDALTAPRPVVETSLSVSAPAVLDEVPAAPALSSARPDELQITGTVQTPADPDARISGEIVTSDGRTFIYSADVCLRNFTTDLGPGTPVFFGSVEPGIAAWVSKPPIDDVDAAHLNRRARALVGR